MYVCVVFCVHSSISRFPPIQHPSTILHHHQTLKPPNVSVPCSGSLATSLVIITIHSVALTPMSVSPKTVLTFSIVVWVVQSRVVHFVYNRVVPSAEGGLFPFPPSCLSLFVRILVYFQIGYRLKILVFGIWKNLWLWVSRFQLLASLGRWTLRHYFLLNGGKYRPEDKASCPRIPESWRATLKEPEIFQTIADL